MMIVSSWYVHRESSVAQQQQWHLSVRLCVYVRVCVCVCRTSNLISENSSTLETSQIRRHTAVRYTPWILFVIAR